MVVGAGGTVTGIADTSRRTFPRFVVMTWMKTSGRRNDSTGMRQRLPPRWECLTDKTTPTRDPWLTGARHASHP